MGDVEQWARTIIAVLGALAAIAAGARYLYRKFIGPAVDNINAAADIIHRQLNPNGGASLLDHVNQIPKISKKLDSVERRLEKVEAATATPKEVDSDVG